MVTSKEILKLVLGYVKDKDINSFASSFAETFYDIEKTGDAFAVQLSYDIESLLAAVTHGACTEDAFYKALKAITPSNTIYTVQDMPVTEQSIMMLEEPAWESFAPVDKLHAAVYASTTFLPSTPQTNVDLPPLLQRQAA